MHNQEFNNITFSEISEEEKYQLKKRIQGSIKRYKFRRNLVKYTITAAAASVVLLFSLIMFTNTNLNNSLVEKFADVSQKEFLFRENTLLVTANNTLNVNGTTSKVAYNKNGLEVQINKNTISLKDNANTKDNNYNTLLVPYGKRSEILLSDGSKVWLNSGSKLVYPNVFSGDKREIYLEGEAIFDVSHNKSKPFIVKSKDHNITVLGTVFNVSNYPEEKQIQTVLKEGSIKIDFKNNALLNKVGSKLIAPGTLAVYGRTENKLDVKQVNVEAYFSWRKGVLIFNSDALETVMKKISRYYNVEISILDSDLAKESFSGQLNLKGDVKKILSAIKEATGFKYSINNNKVVIERN